MRGSAVKLQQTTPQECGRVSASPEDRDAQSKELIRDHNPNISEICQSGTLV